MVYCAAALWCNTALHIINKKYRRRTFNLGFAANNETICKRNGKRRFDFLVVRCFGDGYDQYGLLKKFACSAFFDGF